MKGAWPGPRVLAHRGGGTHAPENTLAAIRHGASLGFRGVEFDVMLAGDATPVLIHDETLARTTGAEGEVARTPYAAIAALDAGAWKGERWRGERVPTFAAAARLCRELGLWVNVEIKPAKGLEAETGRVVAAMACELWRDVPGGCLLSSFHPQALEAAREAAPGVPRGFIVRQLPEGWQEAMRALGCVSLHCKHQLLERAQAEAVRAAGHGLACWTVNDPAAARKMLEWGADCLITDALDAIGPDFA